MGSKGESPTGIEKEVGWVRYDDEEGNAQIESDPATVPPPPFDP